MTPTGMTKIVITKTRKVVPTIIGRTPVGAMSKKSFFGVVETESQERPCQPLMMMLIRIVARMPRISSVARPVRPVKKNDQKSKRAALKCFRAFIVDLRKKFQAPSSDIQRSSKHQTPNHRRTVLLRPAKSSATQQLRAERGVHAASTRKPQAGWAFYTVPAPGH